MPLLLVEKVKVTLPSDGEFVYLKAKFSRSDLERRKARIIDAQRINPDGSRGDISPGDIYLAGVFGTLELAIVSWSFPEPVTPENIELLDDASFDCLTQECERLYGGALSESAKKNLSGSGARQPARAAGSRRNSGS